MKISDITEFGMEAPYMLPSKTPWQRATQCVLFIPVFLIGACIVVLSIPVLGGKLIYDYIRNG